MKNLIDVNESSRRNKSRKYLNKIKLSMICVVAILLNGPFPAIASDMFITPATFFAAHIVSARELITEGNNIPHILLRNGIITSQYGGRVHPIQRIRKNHTGLDIGYKRGTPVYAPAYGVVTFSGWKTGYGNVIIIDHQNGYTSLFAHNSENLVNVGDFVTPDTIISKVGSTGFATGPHVHVEITFNANRVNPISFVHH